MAAITGTLTLTDFLLARVAEDEAAVNSRTRHLAPAGWSYLEQFGDFGDDERWMIEIPAGRVLAEVDAKRRIVELHHAVPVAPGRRELTCIEDGSVAWPCPTLRLLALPYASHEDFRQDWKP